MVDITSIDKYTKKIMREGDGPTSVVNPGLLRSGRSDDRYPDPCSPRHFSELDQGRRFVYNADNLASLSQVGLFDVCRAPGNELTVTKEPTFFDVYSGREPPRTW